MFISRIELDPANRATVKALSSPQIIHAAVQRCFDCNPNGKGRNLWRLDAYQKKLYMLLVSSVCPDFAHLATQFSPKDASGEHKDYAAFLSEIKTGQQFRFRFRGNPIYRKPRTERNQRGKICPHVTIKHQEDWLLKKSVDCGFRIAAEDGENSLAVVDSGMLRFYRERNSPPVQIVFAVYEGVLDVVDCELFVNCLTNGIGKAKAYGCGMMTVARVK